MGPAMLVTLLLALGLIAASGTSSVVQAAGQGLVAAYSFNEGAGGSAGDGSGNGHTGVISGAAWTPQGKFGGALIFNGVDNWVTVGATSLLDLTTGMTLEAWVFPTTATGVQDIVIKEGTNVDIYNLYARNGRGLPESNVFVGGVNRTAEGVALPTNQWTHLAGTYDGVTLRLFINGVETASAAISGSIPPSTGPLRLGGNSIWGEFFHGIIDEVRIYNRALSLAEIQSDMNTSVEGAQPGAPTVAITSPLDQATVAGVISITASATDDVGVTGVQFFLDGIALGAELGTAPYTMTWDTTTASVGPHIVTARARDGDGHVTTSTAVSVAVQNNSVPGNFHDEVVIGTGLVFPTAFEFLPDGRMLIAEFRGRLLVAQPGASTVDAVPVIDLPNVFNEDVTVGGERGLVNVIADPDFVNNGHIYVFYTAANPQRDRVSRLTMVGNTASPASEFVVWQGVSDSTSTDHHGGGLAFGPDGKLYISTGDNGDPPTSQPLTSDHGKILRVNKDGTVPSDNPFFDGNGPNIDAIWARGLRNPYRISFDTATGRLYIGDVGQNSVEEVNLGTRGANYGWPVCEGPCGSAGMANPIFSYSHSGRDASITGGFVYRGSQFPASYQGVYFYGDFAQNWIRYLTFDGAGNVTGSVNFLPPDGTLDGPFDPVMLKEGPDGALYYVDFGWGWQGTVNPAAIRRIRFISGNQPPVAVVAAAPQSGQAPLSVSFSSAGSYDPEGQPLFHAWTFGDGGSSNAANPVHVYAESGVYIAQLALSDGTTTTMSRALIIEVGNPPQGEITSPPDGLVFRAGDVISFAGTATDLEDGPLPASAYSWTILFHHDTHVHPTLGPTSGVTAGTFTIPTTGHDFSGATSYEIILTVTDSAGLSSTRSVFIYPHKVDLTFVTDPPGLAITVDGVNSTTPYVKDTLTGFQHVIAAFDQAQGATNYGFVSWSDAGAQTHTVTAGDTGASYTATFQSTTVTAFPTSTTILSGTLSGGTAAALRSDDNVYYAVNSTTSGTRTSAWYGSFTNVPKGLTSLKVSYKGNNSRNCTQTVAIWNWSTSAWAQLDSRTVGTTEVALNNLTPGGPLTNYVSGSAGTGELRVRIQCQATANLTNRGDLMSIVYDAPVGPPPPDTAAPVRSNGSPSGTLPAGTSQAALSLTTNEPAVCRYATIPGVAYGSMPNVFSTTGGTTHSVTVAPLADGQAYDYFVRCQDLLSNFNTDDVVISFSIATPGSAGLVAAYGFNEGAGTTVFDKSGNGLNGVISGATWITQGKFGNALSFNGTSDWVTVSNASPLNLTTGMTLEAWVFPTATTGVRDILLKEGTNVDIYNLYARNGHGRPEANVFVGGVNRMAEGSALPANAWRHVAGTYDGATLRLFINGVQVASEAVSGSIPASTGPLRIGGNGIWGEFFRGRIDEVRIYNRALSQSEIQADMNTPIE